MFANRRFQKRYLLLVLALFGLALAIQHRSHISQELSKDASNPGYSIHTLPPSGPRFAITKGSHERPLHFIARANSLVHIQTYHCGVSNFEPSYLERLLALLSRPFSHSLDPKHIFKSGLIDPERFYCGFCHQRSYVLHDLLKKNGIKSLVWGMGNHVTVRVDLDGHTYIVDPDYGVGPIEMPPTPENIPTLVRSHYMNASVENIAALTTTFENFYKQNPAVHRSYNMGDLEKYRQRQTRYFRITRWAARLLLVGNIALILFVFIVGRRQSKKNRSAE